MKSKTKLLRLVMLCMLMLFSASEMWAIEITVDVKCEPTGIAKVYAKFETEAEYTENQKTILNPQNSGNFNLKYDNLQEGYTFLGWSKGAPSTNASDMVSTDQVATVTVLSSEPTVTYYANFADGPDFNLNAGTLDHGTIAFTVYGNAATTAKEGQTVTVAVTPDEGYNVQSITGEWTSTFGAAHAPRRAPSLTTIPVLGDIALTPVEGQENTWTFTMQAANATFSATLAPIPYTVTLKEGTEDAANWTFDPAEAKTTGVAAGTEITATYSGTKRVKSVKAKKKEPDPLATPLTMEALTAGNIQVNMSDPLTTGMKYSVNGGAKTLINTTTTIDVAAGDKVQFYGNGTSTQVYGYNPEVKLLGTAQTKAYGNIMSLLDEDNFATLTALPNRDYVFYGLFKNNANLTDASGLLLPATTLTKQCYCVMFLGCSSLTAAPVLPATTLAESCYNSMFSGCSSLTAAPALPATTLVRSCYASMFKNCSTLTAAPALPATTLAESCYNCMFNGCSSLTAAPALPVTTLAKNCYYQMFYGCSSLTAAPALPATTLAVGCYCQMFQNCSHLNSVTCLATDISASDCIKDWLLSAGSAVQGTKTFYKAASMTGWGTNIPDGWTVEDAPSN